MSLVERMTLDINRRELIKKEIESRSDLTVRTSSPNSGAVFGRLIDDTNRRNLASKKLEIFVEKCEEEKAPIKKYAASEEANQVYNRLIRDARYRKESYETREKIAKLQEESEMSIQTAKLLDKKKAEELIKRLNEAAKIREEKLKVKREQKEENEISEAVRMANRLHPKRELDQKVMERLTRNKESRVEEGSSNAGYKKVLSIEEAMASGERLTSARSSKPPRAEISSQKKKLKKVNSGELESICQRLYSSRSYTPSNRSQIDKPSPSIFQKNKKQLLLIPRKSYYKSKSKSPTRSINIEQSKCSGELQIMSETSPENAIPKAELLNAANGYFDVKEKPSIKQKINLLVPSSSSQHFMNQRSPERGRQKEKIPPSIKDERTPSPIKNPPIPISYSKLDLNLPSASSIASPSCMNFRLQPKTSRVSDLYDLFQQENSGKDSSSHKKQQLAATDEPLSGRNTQTSLISLDLHGVSLENERKDQKVEKKLDNGNWNFSNIVKSELGIIAGIEKSDEEKSKIGSARKGASLDPGKLSPRICSQKFSEESLYLMKNPLKIGTQKCSPKKFDKKNAMNDYRFVIGMKENGEFIYDEPVNSKNN
ncbi:unnamed protein product [Blepharisma stoltei]|uniref:Uncharacterized protein n=1 Tax=Blepharisma stoltei TaxID=1481888 RepID=A0AAU9J7V5_9CILI|nr:unnamed protein product [Blepharisma stoltei]